MIVDLFAGPGGWEVGLAYLGHDERKVGIEWDGAACETRAAAGLPTVRADVSQYRALDCRVLIASPPCQSFSIAGNKDGLKDQKHLFELIEQMRLGARWDELDLEHGWADMRSRLVLEPLRWVEHAAPEHILLEQVPGVLGLWTAMGHVWERMGYSWVAETLCAADYGVPQTRERAILIASRTKRVQLPPPTHTDVRLSPSLFLEPWVTMAEALGWGMTRRPYMSITTATDGTKLGGESSRETLRNVAASEHWVGYARRNDRADGLEYRERDLRSSALPSHTVTTRARDWKVNTGRHWLLGGTREDAQIVTGDEPAPTVTTLSGGQWQIEQPEPDEPAQRELGSEVPWVADVADVKDWAGVRPSTTIAGRALAPDPGTNANRYNGATKSRNDGIHLSEADGLTLQSFPADYPLRGTRVKRWQQIGNAIPPGLAAAVLAQVLR